MGSVIAAPGLSSTGSASCGAQAYLLAARGIFLDQGLNHMSPALTGGFLPAGPPAKPVLALFSFDD